VSDYSTRYSRTRKVIPGGRCALARHLGPREHNTAAGFLYREWLPASGVAVGDFPIFFHYVNVGPDVKDAEMITDVYLPLKGSKKHAVSPGHG